MPFNIGDTIAGKYRIERVLGQGGMGTVYLATHTLLDRPVALKLLRSEASKHPEATERLLREGRALARMRGEHIARVLDVVVSENGPCFLILEYLEGEDLGAIIKRSGPLPINVAVTHILQACEGLAEAHSHGIIHRDIKPSNLFFTLLSDGSRGIKIIDFGISKQSDQGMVLTHSRSIVGSPCYMAPEQLRSNGIIDARCDIWSLGVVLYEMLTGERPHGGSTVLELCASILESVPKSPQASRADVPNFVDAAVRRCLARDPRERFATVSELARALALDCDSNSGRLAWNLSEEPKVPTSSLGGSPLEIMPSSLGSAQLTESDCARPARRGNHMTPFAWILGMSLVASALCLSVATYRKRVAAAAPVGIVGSATAMQKKGDRAVTPAPHTDTSLPARRQQPGLATSTLNASSIAPSRAIQRRTASAGGAPTKGTATSTDMKSVTSTSDIESDPVLRYGHY